MASKSLRMAVVSAAALGVFATPMAISIGSGVAAADKCAFTNASEGPAVEGGVRSPSIQGEDRGVSSQGDTRAAGLGIVQAQGTVRGNAVETGRGEPLVTAGAFGGGGNGWGAGEGPSVGTSGNNPSFEAPYC